jgi:hypothetical protein
MARAIPEMVAMSGFRPPGFAGFLTAPADASIDVADVGFAAPVVAMRSTVDRFAIACRFAIAGRRRVVGEHAPPELHDALHYFIGGLAYA